MGAINLEKVTLEKINEIRKSVDIVDVISRYLNVVKKGRNYFAICPFHNDTNPSLSISREKQIYKCFVCGEGGNVITFIQKYKKISFIEALKEVALIGGIELQLDVKKSVSVDPKKQVLYDLLEDATKYYQSALASSQLAQDYIQKRNLSDAVLHEFRIGYSLDADKLIKYLKSKQYREEDILRSGIAIETEQGELKDRFANRLIFPLQDLNGNIVGFSGRIIQKSDMAKYINSPETEIFIKGDTFYHYYAALNSIKKSKKVYLCEGFMDVIAYFKSTIPHAIALMGTAFTKNHLKALKYLGVEVTSDKDGILQDVHWAEGDFGYFPSYLIGSIYDGIFLEIIEKQLGSINEILSSGNIKVMTKFLIDNVYVNGGAYTGRAVLKALGVDEISIGPVVNYFYGKYGNNHGLRK